MAITISSHPGVLLVSIWVLGCIAVVVHRLIFSPLAHVPGPKLAAVTLWYEFYYDVIKRGSYFREIARMHEKYGPIVRINPFELHVNDAAFYPVLYSGAAKKRDKWPWAAAMFGNSTSVFSTVRHEHHRIRRAALNPLFSRAAVKQLEPTIHATLERLCGRIDEFAESGRVLDLGLAFAVFAADVISAHCFGDPFGLLQHPDFAPDWVETVAAPSELGHLVKQCPWLLPLLRWLPRSFVKIAFPAVDRLYTIQEWMSTHVQSLIDNRGRDVALPSTTCVFDGLLQSKLPSEEKTVQRLKGEGQTLIGAGTLTTANVLKTVVFHTLDDPARLDAVVAELQAEFPDPKEPVSLHRLEKLPLLTAYITEGLRLAYGVTHRLQLLSDEPLHFNGVQIPPRTPVGMTSIFMHDNPVVFPEPRAFRPERWAGPPETQHLLRRHYVPFSKGTRMCLGMHLAWAEIYIVLGTLFRSYELSLSGTRRDDVEMAHDFFDPVPKLDSKGLRVRVQKKKTF
ncbi:putative cytochrome P450 [Hypomontagnella submonticulosa]|nr:putative cytochrome P450 [Hypomontagnella submonticulosa]